MSDERMNKHPEFLQETMFQEHGTKVLITNPKADQYLKQHRDKYSQWTEEETSETE
tara:strand:- start:7707 stop:7874 length:168 start_codon:yes stop_codon:yes gene_type:complete